MRFLRNVTLFSIGLMMCRVAVADEKHVSEGTLIVRHSPKGVQLSDGMLSMMLYAPSRKYTSERLVVASNGEQPPGILATTYQLKLNKETDVKDAKAATKSLISDLEELLNERLYERPKIRLLRRREDVSEKLEEIGKKLFELEARNEADSWKHGPVEEIRKRNNDLQVREKDLKIRGLIESKRAELVKKQLGVLAERLSAEHEKAAALEKQQSALLEAKEAAGVAAKKKIDQQGAAWSSTHQRLLEMRQSFLRRLEAQSVKHNELELERALSMQESDVIKQQLAELSESRDVVINLVANKREIARLEREQQAFEELHLELTKELESLQEVKVEFWD